MLWLIKSIYDRNKLDRRRQRLISFSRRRVFLWKFDIVELKAYRKMFHKYLYYPFFKLINGGKCNNGLQLFYSYNHTRIAHVMTKYNVHYVKLSFNVNTCICIFINHKFVLVSQLLLLTLEPNQQISPYTVCSNLYYDVITST